MIHRTGAVAALVVAVACSRAPRDGADSSSPAATPAVATPTGDSASEAPPETAPPPAAPAPDTATKRPPSAVARPDTLRGVVLVVGAEPQTMVALRTATRTITVGGAAESDLRRVVGAEVYAEGRRGGDPLRAWLVDRFIVRAMDGVPARDGILETSGDAIVLRLADGSRSPIVSPPAALRTHVGQRVWLTGSARAAPEAWGLIGAR